MKTKSQITSDLKAQYPTLKIGNDYQGYTDLDAKSYETKIAEWAEAEFAVIQEQAKADSANIAKAALLERLGISEDEAKLLLK
jgi:hypothetical protein